MSHDDDAVTRSTMPSLEARVQALEDIATLHALKARYAEAADAKYTPDGQRSPDETFQRAARAQAECFTEDGVWEGGAFGGDLIGRTALYDNFLRAPWRYAMHFYQAPSLTLHGDTATGKWLLWQTAVREADGEVVLLSGRTHERYRRTAEGWRIERMRFDSLHTLVVATDPRALVCVIPTVQPIFPSQEAL